MKENVHPLDIVFRLAEDHGIVLLNGSGFEAPDWSVRVSFANLNDHVYDDIGRAVRAVARGYRQAYEASKGKAAQAGKAAKAKAEPKATRQEVDCESRECGRPQAGRQQTEMTDMKHRSIILGIATLVAMGGFAASLQAADLPNDQGARDRRHDRRRAGERDGLRLQVRRLRRELAAQAPCRTSTSSP